MPHLSKTFIIVASAWLFAIQPTVGATLLPTFEGYQETVTPIKANINPKIISSKDREFRTRIREAASQSVNFSGHYVFTTFGCGASCVMAFALDRATGKVTWLPFTVCCWESNDPDFEPIAFRKNSRLLVVTGSRNEEGKGVYYYELKDKGFELIQETTP